MVFGFAAMAVYASPGWAVLVEYAGVQPPLILAALGQGLRRECHRGIRVTAELGEEAAQERDQRGHVHQQAAGPVGSRLNFFELFP